MKPESAVRLDPRSALENNPYCVPLREMYDGLLESPAASWNQIEGRFLTAMTSFDSGLPTEFDADPQIRAAQSKALSGALQNGKGDWFNNVLAQVLVECSGVPSLFVRRNVPGLIIPTHNLDGVFPGEPGTEIEFLLEAKMMGTPKHANSGAQGPAGRIGSADTNKRVKELAFKSIDLKGEAARRRTMFGEQLAGGGAGGGDLSMWLHSSKPRIYFFLAARVLNDTDFAAVVRWAEAAAQVVDAVGLYCYEPVPGTFTTYQPRPGVPTAYELERVLFRAGTELQALNERQPTSVTALPSPATVAEDLSEAAE
jgi:hypothetical protein